MSIVVAPAEGLGENTGNEGTQDTSGLLQDTSGYTIHVNGAWKPQNNDDTVPRVYKRRWYILLLFSLAGATQGMIKMPLSSPPVCWWRLLQ